MATDSSVTITMRGKLWEVRTIKNGQVTISATFDSASAADRAAKAEERRLAASAGR